MRQSTPGKSSKILDIWQFRSTSYPKGQFIKAVSPIGCYKCSSRWDSWLKGICQKPLLASSSLKSDVPANCARVSSTWVMGNVSHRMHSLRGFKSTQILTSPDRFGTTTIPAHHEVGSVILVVTPKASIRSSSSRTFSRRGRATLCGEYREYGMALSFNQMMYSSFMLPRPSNTFGNCRTTSSSVLTAFTRQRSWRAIMAGSPNKLAWRSLTTKTLCFVCLCL